MLSLSDLPSVRAPAFRTERKSFTFDGHTRRVNSLSVSPDGETLLTASSDGTLRMWEVSTSRCERVWDLGVRARNGSKYITPGTGAAL